MTISGKVAFITGAGSGIGRACAELFCEEGASVVIAEWDREKGQSIASSLTARGFDCLFVETDVSNPESMQHAVDETIRKHGRIDILHNNAGGSASTDGSLVTIPLDEFWRKINIDLFGTWLGCRYVIPHMQKQGKGSIINMTSVLALKGMPGKDAYTAAKGAIISLSRSLAVEFAPNGIRVNVIAPGSTMSERVLARLGQAGSRAASATASSLLGPIEPKEIADAALFLASDKSVKMTGQVMVVDSALSIQ